MSNILNMLGVKKFKNVRALTLMAVLIALAVIGYGLLRIEPVPGVRVSFGFIFLATIAYLFGPVAAFSSGIMANMLAFVLFPSGASFNPLFDLNRGLAGLLYAIFLFRRNTASEYFIIWVVAAKASVNIICHIVINTYLLVLMGWIHSDSVNVFTVIRVFRNVTFLPFEVILLFIVLKFVAVYAKKYKFTDPPKKIKKEVA